MAHSPSVHRLAADEWRTYRDLRLRALADSPDAFASTFERESARPDSEWARRLETGARSPTDLPLMARVGEDPAGLAWGRIRDAAPDVADLFQVWVTPEHRRRGIARMLLDAVAAWAREAGARHIALDVTCESPAMRLYTRAGFRPSGDPQPLRPGSPLRSKPMRLALTREESAPAASG